MSTSEPRDARAPYLLFVLALSVIALLVLFVEQVVPFDPEQKRVFEIFDWVVCAVFFVDFLVTLGRVEKKGRYLWTWGWLDLISSIPSVAAFRLARSARIVRILRVLKILRASRILTRSFRRQRAESGLSVVGVVAFCVLFVGSVAILQVERVDSANIVGADDAVWWALSTMTSVGYGDRFPVTAEGRLVAGVLMIFGVGLFGTLSGFCAAWFVEPGDSRRESELESLKEELTRIRALLEPRGAHPPSPTGGGQSA